LFRTGFANKLAQMCIKCSRNIDPEGLRLIE